MTDTLVLLLVIVAWALSTVARCLPPTTMPAFVCHCSKCTYRYGSMGKEYSSEKTVLRHAAQDMETHAPTSLHNVTAGSVRQDSAEQHGYTPLQQDDEDVDYSMSIDPPLQVCSELCEN